MRDQLLEWLRKAARYLRTASNALGVLASAVEALIAMLDPGFGFGAA
jgi:hypothetical protein